MIQRKDDQTFPRSGFDGSTEIDMPHDGVNVRDWIAIQAMVAYIVSNPQGNNALTQSQIAVKSFQMADIMINQSQL